MNSRSSQRSWDTRSVNRVCETSMASRQSSKRRWTGPIVGPREDAVSGNRSNMRQSRCTLRNAHDVKRSWGFSCDRFGSTHALDAHIKSKNTLLSKSTVCNYLSTYHSYVSHFSRRKSWTLVNCSVPLNFFRYRREVDARCHWDNFHRTKMAPSSTSRIQNKPQS